MQKKTKDLESRDSNSSESENPQEEQDMDTDAEENVSGDEEEAGPSGSGLSEKPAKKKKRGIIYISSIPKYMNVTILREMLSQYAKIGRIFLQPGKLSSKLKIDKQKSISNVNAVLFQMKKRIGRRRSVDWHDISLKVGLNLKANVPQNV